MSGVRGGPSVRKVRHETSGSPNNSGIRINDFSAILQQIRINAELFHGEQDNPRLKQSPALTLHWYDLADSTHLDPGGLPECRGAPDLETLTGAIRGQAYHLPTKTCSCHPHPAAQCVSWLLRWKGKRRGKHSQFATPLLLIIKRFSPNTSPDLTLERSRTLLSVRVFISFILGYFLISTGFNKKWSQDCRLKLKPK